jgi:hypothetical protein
LGRLDAELSCCCCHRDNSSHSHFLKFSHETQQQQQQKKESAERKMIPFKSLCETVEEVAASQMIGHGVSLLPHGTIVLQLKRVKTH